MARKNSKNERVFKGEELTKGWRGITDNKSKVWWFDTSEEYSKRYSLDRAGVPIYWDDGTYTVEDIRESTMEDTCTVVLTDKRERKALVIVHKKVPQVLIRGAVEKDIEWEEYTREGLWSVKKHCLAHTLEAVVINPKIKTLNSMGFVKSLVAKALEGKDLLKEGGNGSPDKENTKDQGNAEPGGSPEGVVPDDQRGGE